MEPPLALMPFTVWNSRAVSKSQTTLPSSAEYPRRWPSIEAENTTPGIAVTAADCAGLQPDGAFGAQTIGGAYQTLVPNAPSGCSPAQSAAVTAIPGVVFSASMDG